MTDQEIIQGLLERDNEITRQFLYVRCRPLLNAIIHVVFNYQVDYDEMVSELYSYLMANDGAKLRQFQYRSSIYQWLKVVATRFFIARHNNVIENASKEPLYQREEDEHAMDSVKAISDRIDIDNLLRMMNNQRYADAIRHLVINDMEPEKYASQIGVTVDNLYNIKKRAMSAFAELAIKYFGYGR